MQMLLLLISPFLSNILTKINYLNLCDLCHLLCKTWGDKQKNIVMMFEGSKKTPWKLKCYDISISIYSRPMHPVAGN